MTAICLFCNIFHSLGKSQSSVRATLKWPPVGQHVISTLFLFLHHSILYSSLCLSLCLPVSETLIDIFCVLLCVTSSSSHLCASLYPFSSFTTFWHFKDSGSSFRYTWNINICTHRTHTNTHTRGHVHIRYQHPSSTHHPLPGHGSLTLLERDKGLFYTVLHSCMTAMSTEEPWETHTGRRNESKQRTFLRFHVFFFPPPKLFFPLKNPTCMCWFHQKNLKQLTVSPLSPHCCLNTYIPTTNRHTPRWVPLPPSPCSSASPLNLCWFILGHLAIKARLPLSESSGSSCLKASPSHLIDLRV